MKTRYSTFHMAVSLCAFLVAAMAQAADVVHFDSAGVAPSPLKQRQEKAAGQPTGQVPGIPLIGYLTRPEGKGPFPAVVLMHGCGGLNSSVKDDWPKRLAAWGYVALAVDSFTTRNIKNTCHSFLYDRVDDAYGALDFLSKSGFVDPERVVLMGFSAGGITTLQAIRSQGVEQLMDRKFKAAVTYYPLCAAKADMTVPTLVLSGASDDWSPLERCQRMLARDAAGPKLVQLDVYPNASHGFDDPAFAGGVHAFGHLLEYNAQAAQKSFADVRAFLQKTIGQ